MLRFIVEIQVSWNVEWDIEKLIQGRVEIWKKASPTKCVWLKMWFDEVCIKITRKWFLAKKRSPDNVEMNICMYDWVWILCIRNFIILSNLYFIFILFYFILILFFSINFFSIICYSLFICLFCFCFFISFHSILFIINILFDLF